MFRERAQTLVAKKDWLTIHIGSIRLSFLAKTAGKRQRALFRCFFALCLHRYFLKAKFF
ncbi:hypothetical protein HMPREF3213_03748 [Heyndrickxia coagulans]|uniref:Uncharacterized protein n=1 Tax=Heyndrickxia coagulans TaxID=1398 RepID=A0A133KAA7_HEYCO|nr:hypothetical protein HMPREF3213_03748 [Heyndrickxia coagulans]